MFEIAVVCLVLTALLAYVNHRFIGLPTTIGVMAVALLLSLGLIVLDRLGFGALREYEAAMLRSIDFSELLMEGMLSLLLFAGALHIDLSELRAHRWQVGLLAVAGTALSTAIVGFGLHWLLPMVGLELSHCRANQHRRLVDQRFEEQPAQVSHPRWHHDSRQRIHGDLRIPVQSRSAPAQQLRA